MVPRPIFDRLEQREDLALAEDPLRQLLLEGWPVDRGAGVERQVPHPSRERQQRLERLEPAATGGRGADEAVRIALQIRKVGGAQRLAGEAPEGRDVVAVSADGVRALAVQPQGDQSASVVSGRIGVGAIVQSRAAASSSALSAWGSGLASGTMRVNIP
jgi:hypothetical protein